MNLSLLLCLSAFCFVPLAYASDCGQSLDGAPQDLESEISPDDRAIRWLKDLLGSELKWPAQDAHAAVARLLAGSRESPVSEGAVSNNADLYVHRLGLAELMREVSDPVAVGRALQEEIGRREGSAQSRRETKEEVELELYVRMNFGEIPPGSFSTRLRTTSHLIDLPLRFWMALTPVTQWQLGQVLPRLGRSDRAANSPAGDLTYDEAQKFVDELNQWARTNDPRLLRVVPNHQPTWRYSLPDAWEWMYVASNLAANSSGIEAWRQNSGVSELTLGGFTSMDQAAPHYRGKDDSVYRAVDELDPIIILGSKFHDLGGKVQTWLRPNPWSAIRPFDWTWEKGKTLNHIQAPGIFLKELKWFDKDVRGLRHDTVPTSEIVSLNSKNAPPISFYYLTKTTKRTTLGVRLIAFEVDAETDARLNPNIPVDEAATIARLGAAYLANRIQNVVHGEYSAASAVISKKSLNETLQVMYTALKDWKEGRRNLKFENEFLRKFGLMEIFQHPALDLRRLAHELEAQIKAREVMP